MHLISLFKSYFMSGRNSFFSKKKNSNGAGQAHTNKARDKKSQPKRPSLEQLSSRFAPSPIGLPSRPNPTLTKTML